MASVTTSTTTSLEIDWEDLGTKRKQVTKFLKSLNEKIIGTGLVIYDEERFRLLPRSNWFNNHYYQWMVSIRTKGASFGETQQGFLILLQKIQSIVEKIKGFNPTQTSECPATSSQFLIRVLEIEKIITNVASKGLARLCLNYEGAGKVENARSLHTLGNDSFVLIDQLKTLLKDKLFPHLPELRQDLELNRCSMIASKLLNKRHLYLGHLQKIEWSSDRGVVIPFELIEGCRKDLKKNANLTRAEIRNAANLIRLPSQTPEVLVQEGKAKWIPMRPVKEGSRIEFQPGIIGSCERDGLESLSLSNFFYSVQAGYLRVSCAAIDCLEKSEQMIAFIQKMTQENNQTKTRWILHQLNSFYTEEKLIIDVHHQAQYMDTALCAIEATCLHINTSFNVAVTYASENPQSVQKINLESLAELVRYAVEDFEPQILRRNNDFRNRALNTALVKINELSRAVRKNKFEISSLFTSQSKDALVTSPALQRSSQGNTPTETSISELKRLEKELLENQEYLKEKLHELINIIYTHFTGIHSVPTDQNYDADLKKEQLVFNILWNILKLQLEMPCSASSRCNEVEYFFLLYRLLGINVITSCYSGLDRTGLALAFQDSMEQLEEHFYDRYCANFEENAARVKAQSEIFKLINSLKQNREELMNITYEMMKTTTFSFVDDFSSYATVTSFNFQEALFQKIDQEHPDDQSAVNGLRYTQSYLELIAKHLLSSQAQKTLFSTGLIGNKFNHDVYFGAAGNPHPIERLPMFIADDRENSIQLLKYEKGYLSDSVNFSPIGIALFMRLSQWRGK